MASSPTKEVEKCVFATFRGVLATATEHTWVYPRVCRATVSAPQTGQPSDASAQGVLWSVTLVPPSWVLVTSPEAACPTLDALDRLKRASNGQISDLQVSIASMRIDQEIEYPTGRTRLPQGDEVAGEPAVFKMTHEHLLASNAPLCIVFKWQAVKEPVTHAVRGNTLAQRRKRVSEHAAIRAEKRGAWRTTGNALLKSATFVFGVLSGTGAASSPLDARQATDDGGYDDGVDEDSDNDNDDDGGDADGDGKEEAGARRPIRQRRAKRNRGAAAPSTERDDSVYSSGDEMQDSARTAGDDTLWVARRPRSMPKTH